MTPTECLSLLSITVETMSGPVPHNADGWQAIEFTVSVKRNGREILQTPYRLGLGHVDIKKSSPPRTSLTTDERYMLEAWQAKPYANFKNKELQTQVACKLAKQQKVTPKPEDVVYSLVMDSSVLDYSTFEEWASEYGYDPDSRKAESIYRACMEITLKMHNALGESGFETLRNAFQDY